jgi:uncharacterized protein YndB with AHSA1/START domain
MKLSTSQDISAPIAFVYEAITDFDAFEKFGLGWGATVERINPNPGPEVGVGTEWRIAATYRGKERRVRTRITEMEAPGGFRTISKSSGLETDFIVELVSTGEASTRANVSLEGTGQTLAGRLLLQSLKLARGNLNRRFSDRIAKFAKTIEEKHQRLS